MKILLVGTGGFAGYYVNILLNEQIPSVTWEGIVDPYYSACKYREKIDALNIPVYDTIEEFFARHTADLTIICTPTYLHCEQSISALSNGSNVLCEKPVAPTEKEAKRMLDAENKYGRFIAIGYQWSYSDAMQKLKKDILNGTLGAPISFKTVISWPRSKDYYERGSGWGGKIEKDGRLILDSIASNACSHYLHNMFFVLGNTMQTSSSLTDIKAECYRANDIENFDTCCIKMKTENGVKLYFAASHAAGKLKNPEFIYAFQNGVVKYSKDEGSQIIAQFNNGEEKIYGNPYENAFKKLWDCIDAVNNGTTPVCTVRTALPHVQLIENIYKTTKIHNFPKEHIKIDKEQNTIYVPGLFESLNLAYEKCFMFSETNSDLFQNLA